MFFTPYETTMCSKYKLAAVIQAVSMAKLREELFDMGESDKGITQITDDCPPFTQPLTPREHGMEGVGIVTDIRQYTRAADRNSSNQIVVSAQTEYSLAKLRAQLITLWLQGETGRYDMMMVGDMAALTFNQLITKTLVQRLGLGADHEVKLSHIVGYYYACLFTEESEMDDVRRERNINLVSRWTNSRAMDVHTTLSGEDETGGKPVTYIANIKDLVDVMHRLIKSPRIQQLNSALLYTMLGGSWYNARETVAVALEHPPTWLALLSSAVSNQSFKRTVISKLALNNDRKNRAKDFMTNIHLLVRR